MTKVEGTVYEVMLTSNGYHVFERTQRSVVAGGAPVLLSVGETYATRAQAEAAAIRLHEGIASDGTKN